MQTPLIECNIGSQSSELGSIMCSTICFRIQIHLLIQLGTICTPGVSIRTFTRGCHIIEINRRALGQQSLMEHFLSLQQWRILEQNRSAQEKGPTTRDHRCIWTQIHHATKRATSSSDPVSKSADLLISIYTYKSPGPCCSPPPSTLF